MDLSQKNAVSRGMQLQEVHDPDILKQMLASSISNGHNKKRKHNNNSLAS